MSLRSAVLVKYAVTPVNVII